MPLAEPIDYRILLALQAQLQGMTPDDYHFPVVAPAVKLDPNCDVDALLAPDGPRPFIVIERLDGTDEFVEKPDGLRETLKLRLHWIHESDPTDDASRMRVFLRGCADLETAVCVDRSFGGLAMEATIGRKAMDFTVDGSLILALVDLDVELYRTYGRPNG